MSGGTARNNKVLQEEDILENTYPISKITFQRQKDTKELKDPELVANTLLECIKSGDLDSFRDVLVAHLATVNKLAIDKKAGIGRRTLYDLLDPKKMFNPELSTVSAVIRALAA